MDILSQQCALPLFVGMLSIFSLLFKVWEAFLLFNRGSRVKPMVILIIKQLIIRLALVLLFFWLCSIGYVWMTRILFTLIIFLPLCSVCLSKLPKFWQDAFNI